MYETDEYQVVCAEVLSGDIAGRNIVIEYSTESDTAEGRDPRSCLEQYTQKSSVVVITSLWSLHVTVNEYQ